MRNFRWFTFSIMISCLILLSSCNTTQPKFASDMSLNNPPVNSEDVSSICIPPVASLAYPVGSTPELNTTPTEIPPLGNWQLQSPLPESIKGFSHHMVVKSDKIWVLAASLGKIFTYHINTGKWKSYGTIDSNLVMPENLFASDKETIWGIGTTFQSVDSAGGFPFLSLYNKNTDQFEFIEDIDGILNNLIVRSSPPMIAEDTTGSLWFFAHEPRSIDVGLYSFDPTTNKAEKHLVLEMGASYDGPLIAPDGNLWYYDGRQNQLFTYSPDLHELQPYYGLPLFGEQEVFGELFFDQDGRLWIGNKGWLDFTEPDAPIWYELISSPVFLTDNGRFPIPIRDDLISSYGWDRPYEISQSSNGWYWFTTRHGTIRLEPETAEWCLFTTGSSPVVEDDDGNVWIVVFDKLYKYDLEP